MTLVAPAVALTTGWSTLPDTVAQVAAGRLHLQFIWTSRQCTCLMIWSWLPFLWQAASSSLITRQTTQRHALKPARRMYPIRRLIFLILSILISKGLIASFTSPRRAVSVTCCMCLGWRYRQPVRACLTQMMSFFAGDTCVLESTVHRTRSNVSNRRRSFRCLRVEIPARIGHPRCRRRFCASTRRSNWYFWRRSFAFLLTAASLAGSALNVKITDASALSCARDAVVVTKNSSTVVNTLRPICVLR